MSVSCPRCAKAFRGQSLGHHARVCNLTMADLFWMRVNKNAPNGCWDWTASRKPKGYGQFLWKNKMHRAHRLAWTLSGRDLPPRPLELAHSCDNRICVNPEHLRPATHAENMAECKARGRHARGERTKKTNLTEEQVREIKRSFHRRSKRYTNSQELAQRFNTTPAVVCSIARGDTWEHVK